ncbi:MAG: EF-P beta-lysylation protein EpmB [Porticoccaceae bacterium]
MIPHTAVAWQMSAWQQELANAIRDPAELFALLNLDPAGLDPALLACRDFPLRVPRPYLLRMRKGDAADPLLRQILPLGDELLPVPGYLDDPLNERAANPAPGLVHKYAGRALLIVSPACAINCRYCFRRHFPYQDNKPNRDQWQQALDYIRADTSISEVIYSGGDPLAANDQQLLWLTRQIATISHVRRLRVHTRLPVVIPSRIDRDCLHWLTDTRLQTLVVLHVNHPNELDSQVGQAVALLRAAGITVLNQSVLLAGVNDSADTLIRLSEALFETGILPYYLHLLDPVQGAAHFATAASVAPELLRTLKNSLPGYLVPRLVWEQPGERSKTWLL